MNDLIYWIWLSEALGQGYRNLELISYYNWDPKEIYEADETEIFNLDIYTLKKIKAFKSYPLENAEKSMNDAISSGIKIITPKDECYPKSLRKIDEVPLVLYVYGDENVLNEKQMISFVGAREASVYGCAVAKSLSGALASRGFVIVSGGARGIDSESHFGALEEGGKTVCVLGCGLNTRYLMELKPMRDRIAQNGAIVSEYPPFAPASKRSFPIRNRIIAALSPSTVVVEAGIKSGSLITARLASEFGKEVFAVPGDLVHSSFLGTNKLISDGATAVFSPNDILELYVFKGYTPLTSKTRFPDDEIIIRAQKYLNESEEFSRSEHLKEPKKSPKKKVEKTEEKPKNVEEKPTAVRRELPPTMTENAKKIYAVLSDEPMHVDMISKNSGLHISQTLSALTELEIYSLIKPHPGRRYTIK